MYCNPEEQSGYYQYPPEPYPSCDMSQHPDSYRFPPQSPGAFNNGPPRSPMIGGHPQAWNGPYGPQGAYPQYYQHPNAYISFQIPMQPMQQPWSGEMPKQQLQTLMPPPPPYEESKEIKKPLEEERKEEPIRPASIQPNNPSPIKTTESRPRGRPGRKPSTKAPMSPADIYLGSPASPIKEKVTRKRRRYETEEEKAASRRERNRLAQERSRMRTKEKYETLEKKFNEMKTEFLTMNSSVLESLVTMSTCSMSDILASRGFTGVIEILQKVQIKYGSDIEAAPMASLDHDIDNLDSCSEMSD